MNAGEPSRRRWRHRRFELEVALRYLRTARRDALVKLLSRIASVGLGVGVAALILALAALSGFQERLLTAVQQSTPSLQVEIGAQAEVEEVRREVHRVVPEAAVQLLVTGRGWVGGGGRYESAELIGFEKALPDWLGETVPALSFEFLAESDRQDGSEGASEDDASIGAAGSPLAVWVSENQSRRIGLAPGEPVELVSPRPTLGPRGPQPRARWLPVAGWLRASEVEQAWSERVGVPLAVARSLLGRGNAILDVNPSLLEVPIRGDLSRRSQNRLQALAVELEQRLADAGVQDVRVFDWQDRNKPLLFVLRLEKAAVFVAVVLIVLVASFALLATLNLLLANKSAEIGVLGALGTSPATLRRIFRWVGLLLAGGGGLAGGILGVLLAWILDRFEVLRLPGEVYILDHVPFVVHPGDAVLVILSAVSVTYAATLVGASRASRWRIVEALNR